MENYTIDLDDYLNETLNDDELTNVNGGVNSPEEKPFLRCPQCGYRIPFSPLDFLTNCDVVCDNCGLRLTIKKSKSQKAFDELRKISEAQKNIQD